MKALDLDKLDAFMEIEYDGEIYDAYTENDINDKAINVIPIPDNATNGDIIKAMFPYSKIHEHEKTDICDAHIQIDIWDFSTYVSKDWWNAPYRGNEDDSN